MKTKCLIASCFAATLISGGYAQMVSLSAGTDIPYQYYVGGTLHVSSIDISLRTGVLIPPYSDVILNTIEALGTDEVYINVLNTSYEFGWMNSLGGYYRFSKLKRWYMGFELRLDYLTAADTPTDLIETITGQSLRIGNLINRTIETRLGLTLFGAGLRIGRSFAISENARHTIKTELSFTKYLSTQSSLSVNNQNLINVNQVLDRLLWEDVFKKYGVVGGIGVAYSYRL